LPQQRKFVLYRIAVFATLAYISVFVCASLIVTTVFFTGTLVSAAIPSGSAWAATLPQKSVSGKSHHPVRKLFAAKSPSRPRPRQKVAAKSKKRLQFAQRGWDRNLYAHPARGLYKRSFRVTATAYTPINTRMEGGRYTCTERDGRAVHGIAVDPDLIPIGSQLWIPGYGHAVADDTGGRIRGYHVDVRIQDYDRMLSWGRRNLQIYVISEGSDPAAKKAASRHIRKA
jgi:3D (Asp-Asp-Asp) domain-containing protein